MNSGLLVGYFAQKSDARRIIWMLEKRGFFKTLLLHKDSAGRLHSFDPFYRRQFLGLFFFSLLFSGLFGVTLLFLPLLWIKSQLTLLSSFFVAAASIGLISGWFIIRRSRYGIDAGLLSEYSKTTLSEETLLLLQGRVVDLPIALSLILAHAETSPIVFIKHPSFDKRVVVRSNVCPEEIKKPLSPTLQLSIKRRRGKGGCVSFELLKQIRTDRSWVQEVCTDLMEANRVGQGATGVAEWIIDNEYMLVKTVRDILLNLPKSFFRNLPTVVDEPRHGRLPYIYCLSKKVLTDANLHLTRDQILASVLASQEKHPLSIAELWALPQMLRVALIENIKRLAISAQTDLCDSQQAAFWANRLIEANKRDVNQLFYIMTELSVDKPHPSPYFSTQLIDNLYDETDVLVPVQAWIERSFGTLVNELMLQEQNRQTSDQLAIGNAFTSLRQLIQLDWKELFEQLSSVEQILRQDPSGVYPQMDFATRDRYRQVIETVADRSDRDEPSVAQAVITLAEQNRSLSKSSDEADPGHIGYFLIGAGSGDFLAYLGCDESIFSRTVAYVKKNHTAIYLSGVSILTGLIATLFGCYALTGVELSLSVSLLVLTILPASQIAVEVMNYFVIRFMPTLPLPKMNFQESGIQDEFKTLIVVPTLLLNAKSIQSDLEKLEIRYMSNRENNLLFSLFSDYTDAHQQVVAGDEALYQQMLEGVQRLNDRYGPVFLLFHRERSWCESEQKFIGWERKRGKLEQLNALLDGSSPDYALELVRVGSPEQISHIRFVITLDSDTQLPHGTARRMIETLAHPLNRPRFDATGQLSPGSFTLIQPRVSSSLPSANISFFSRLFAESIGVDPYNRVTADVYQDLTGEGSYHGKGIYDVQAFHRILTGRFPEGLILSHDLIEGAHARTGLASDIELYDEFPPDYINYFRRMHRWIRGDWQIALWLLPWVPLANGKMGKNPLSWFNRWKVFDNLRRSLVPVSSLLLLLYSWMASSLTASAVLLLVGICLFWPLMARMVILLTTRKGYKNFSLAQIWRDTVRIFAEIALMPHLVLVSLGAIFRVLYRMLISHRHLLEWTSSQVVHFGGVAQRKLLIFILCCFSVFSCLLAYQLYHRHPDHLIITTPFLFLWFISPLVGWLLTSRKKPLKVLDEISAQDRDYLRRLTRRTWRYFDDFVNDDTCWLPPDNYQVSHQDQVAMRTSPTNIGLWMLSLLGAHDCGYIGVRTLVDRLSATMLTLVKLEKYEGHLLNWYDLSDLHPLEPRYVSSVDSGNFLSSLWVMEAGLKELRQRPLLDAAVLAGFVDSGTILLRLVSDQKKDDKALLDFEKRLALWRKPLQSSLELVRQVVDDALVLPDILTAISTRFNEESEVDYWCRALKNQIRGAREAVDLYFGWVVSILEVEPQEITPSVPSFYKVMREDLTLLPSLAETCADAFSDTSFFQIIKNSSKSPEWLGRVSDAYDRSRLEAQKLSDQILLLEAKIDRFGKAINMSFLYDPLLKLFAVGYNVSVGRRDESFYDLLASEARLGSFTSIARGDVPMAHWFSMGRPHAMVNNHRVLMSWSGTMFEYLMPLLLQNSYDNSLLHRAVTRAVDIQIHYGRKRKVPWGVSESAYGNLDLNKTYQYMAFGVAELGLKRLMKSQLVVAPYASLLAISIRPKKTLENLKRLENLGLYNNYGFYESIDFSRKATKTGKKGVVVKAYMAHHQGMSFISMLNFLQDNRFRKRFHSDPRVKAFEQLLQERIPTLPPLQLASARENPQIVSSMVGIEDRGKRFTTPHTSIPKTRLLSNSSYNLMLTNTGGGYSQWNGLELTRWRFDQTTDLWGSYIYLYDEERRKLWSAAYHPVGLEADDYEVEFALDRVTFSRTDFDIQAQTDVLVSPEDDVEIRRLSLLNRSDRPRTLCLTSYFELAMAAHNADRQHPAFNKIFIQTEALSERRTLLAYRRSRSDEPAETFMAHRIASETILTPFAFETDRARFIGRGNTLASPAGAITSPGNSQGFVLDPIFSLRHRVTLEPGQRCEVAFILAVARTREEVIALADKYSETYQIDRAMEFAWRSAQIELRLLHIQPEDARWFQQLANHMLFPNQLLRVSADQIMGNHKGQSGLWPYAISGDLPILLVTIAESRDLNLIRQLLQAHSYWRMHGFAADLLIINEEEGAYDQPLREKLINMIQAYASSTTSGHPGNVLLRSADQIPDDDLRLMKAVAAVVLVAARGALSQQLGISSERIELSEPLKIKQMLPDPIKPLDEIELIFFNGLGGFTPDGREYVMTLDPALPTPSPWVNVMANPDFGTMVSESGAGFTWFGNSQRNRLTQWTNDPVLDPVSEVVYLRDEQTGDLWTTTPRPIRNSDLCRVRHGAGYSVFERHSFGIYQLLKQFVPTDDTGGAPVKLYQMTVRNDTRRWRELSVTFYVELTLGEHRESAQMHTVTHWDRRSSSLLGYNRYHPEYGNRVTFVTLDPPPESYSGDRTSFIGRNRSLADPAALDNVHLDGITGARLDPCAALQNTFQLAPGESTVIVCMLGQAGSKDEACQLISRFRLEGEVQTALDGTSAWWDRALGCITVQTPEPAADILINRWLLYQSLSCRIWGRSAFYQSGGAFGFRDQLQDVTAFISCQPELARKQILLAASRQFSEGDVQHWWHPPSGAGIRSRISDDLLWLPYVVAEYLRVTGDVDFLKEEIPFLKAPLLEEGEHEVFSTPEQLFEPFSLFEHCRRAVKKGLTAGPDGLPLFGTGDWNDGMNLVGANGQGESVWLGWFLVDLLQGMVEISHALNKTDEAHVYAQQRQQLCRSIEDKAWDGEWYLRGRFDDGTPLGSAESDEAQIDSLSQSWAWLSGGADPQRAEIALESAWEHLVLQKEKVVLLFSPPFDHSSPSPGYIKGYPPGVRENGGQYTHAALWFAMAMARTGDGDRAVQMLQMMNPIEHSSNLESARHYGVEPYVVAADVYRLPDKVGRGGWSWYTGSAAWMYRAWVEEILGLKRRTDSLVIDPVIPVAWERFSVNYRFGSSNYHLLIENPERVSRGVVSVELDGALLEGNRLPITMQGGEYKVQVIMGSGASGGASIE
ncbi:MAG: glycosyl transferase [Desulfuromonadales bacterium]|nr:glycosyl transferase [Desulfuromonadales bacterium]